ncbi:hypothetical protein C0J52_10135 [Blattella germanica]|nr:hypothetical protein C0J52_10135 [Blattella germanica]
MLSVTATAAATATLSVPLSPTALSSSRSTRTPGNLFGSRPKQNSHSSPGFEGYRVAVLLKIDIIRRSGCFKFHSESFAKLKVSIANLQFGATTRTSEVTLAQEFVEPLLKVRSLRMLEGVALPGGLYSFFVLHLLQHYPFHFALFNFALNAVVFLLQPRYFI